MKSRTPREFASFAKIMRRLPAMGFNLDSRCRCTSRCRAISVTLVENAPLYAGPKFLESISRHASGETFRCAQERVMRIGFTMDAPRVREEVTPDNCHVAGIVGPEAAGVAPSGKGELHDISEASLEGPFRHAKIARIFPQHQASARFNRVSRDAACHAHSIAVGKTIPMRTVLSWPINSRSTRGCEKSARQVRWTERAGDEPLKTLAGRDRSIGRFQQQRLQGRELTWLRRKARRSRLSRCNQIRGQESANQNCQEPRESSAPRAFFAPHSDWTRPHGISRLACTSRCRLAIDMDPLRRCLPSGSSGFRFVQTMDSPSETRQSRSIEYQVDPDRQADEEGARSGPIRQQVDAKGDGNHARNRRPSPPRELNEACPGCAKHPSHDEKRGDQHRDAFGAGVRVS